MDPQLVPFLQALATKLGTTVELLWGVLIKQAYIAGFIDIAQLAVVLLLGLGFIPYYKYVVYKTDADVPYAQRWSGDAWIPYIITAIVYGSIALICTLVSISEITTAFGNPEYWALHKVLENAHIR